MTPVPLASAQDERAYGGKAIQLGAAIRAGLPVPEGFALDAALVDAIASGDTAARGALAALAHQFPGQVAVRSSAIGEDSADASFAGQHATLLNISGAEAMLAAVMEVWQSAHTDSARAYRTRVGAETTGIGMGIVIQRLVPADVAGVLFTRNPVTGQDELVVEATWGLGEAVVQGLVIPDSYRLDPAGNLLESRAGYKDVRIARGPAGGTLSEPVEPHLVEHICLDAGRLAALHGLVAQCHAVFGPGPHDIEWAFEAEALYLLQRRPVTNMPGA